MSWFLKLLPRAVLFVGLMATATGADPSGTPNPSLSMVPNVLVSPGGALEYKVVINGTAGPVNNALVELVFSSEADGLVCWCTGQDHPVIESATDFAGEAIFFIAAGGCIDPAGGASLPVVTVFANGVLMAEVGVVSPDAVDGMGRLPTNGWDPLSSDGGCSTALADATFHTGPFSSGVLAFCSDLDSSGGVDLNDAVLATQALASGEACNISPGSAPSGSRDEE